MNNTKKQSTEDGPAETLAVAAGSAIKVGSRVKTSAIRDEFLTGPASDVWVTRVLKNWLDVEYGPHIDTARIAKSSVLHVYAG